MSEKAYCAHSGRPITTLDVAQMEADYECPTYRSAEDERQWKPRNP